MKETCYNVQRPGTCAHLCPPIPVVKVAYYKSKRGLCPPRPPKQIQLVSKGFHKKKSQKKQIQLVSKGFCKSSLLQR